MSWEAEANEIRRRRELAKEQGGADGISRQHNYGKLTIRERVDAFLDPGSFREHGRMAGGAYLSEDLQSAETFSPANYVVGVGMVDGRRVAVGGEDFTLKGGSPNAAGLRNDGCVMTPYALAVASRRAPSSLVFPRATSATAAITAVQ